MSGAGRIPARFNTFKYGDPIARVCSGETCLVSQGDVRPRREPMNGWE